MEIDGKLIYLVFVAIDTFDVDSLLSHVADSQNKTFIRLLQLTSECCIFVKYYIRHSLEGK